MDEELRDLLKYRVWDNVFKKFREDFHIQANGVVTLYNSKTNSDITKDPQRFSIEQCTGMKDRNGKLIYANDRFKNGGLFWWVVWFRYGWHATAVNEYGSQGWARLEDFDSITILGTIHDEKGEDENSNS